MTNYKLLIFIITVVLSFNRCRNSAEETIRPNILFVISDDQSYPHTSFAGCTFVNTPNFDRVAHEGIYFANAYAASPGCARSRSALVTGRHHWQNEQSGQHFSSWLKKYVPFVDELEANGYVLGKTGKGVIPFRYARNEKDSLWRMGNAAGPNFDFVNYTDEDDERTTTGIRDLNYAENFKIFMDSIRGDKPFFYWFGAYEPHRVYEAGSWRRLGKKLEDVQVPDFFPDTKEIRGDLLDYAVEIEWFDLHLGRMLAYLEEIDELDNTIVIVTADNGMPFPRAKSNSYDYGVHVPMAIRYPKEIPAGKVCETPVGFIDIAPTLFEVTGISPSQMMPITGRSIWSMITELKEDKDRAVFSGRERHSSSRYNNLGYPQRAVRKGDYLFIWNMKPKRWPAGAPQKYDKNDTTKILNMYSLDEDGNYLKDGIFNDIDNSPTKTYLIENHNNKDIRPFFELAVSKRPEYELYNVVTDRACINNLSGNDNYRLIEEELKTLLEKELRQTSDPRVVGPNKEIFDSYKRHAGTRKYPKPEYLK